MYFSYLGDWYDFLTYFESFCFTSGIISHPLGTDHYFFEGGGGWAISKTNFAQQKLLKKSYKGSHGKNIEQVLSPNQVLCLTFEKSFHKLLPTKIILHNLKLRKLNFIPQKIAPAPPPPALKQIIVRSSVKGVFHLFIRDKQLTGAGVFSYYAMIRTPPVSVRPFK